MYEIKNHYWNLKKKKNFFVLPFFYLWFLIYNFRNLHGVTGLRSRSDLWKKTSHVCSTSLSCSSVLKCTFGKLKEWAPGLSSNEYDPDTSRILVKSSFASNLNLVPIGYSLPQYKCLWKRKKQSKKPANFKMQAIAVMVFAVLFLSSFLAAPHVVSENLQHSWNRTEMESRTRNEHKKRN